MGTPSRLATPCHMWHAVPASVCSDHVTKVQMSQEASRSRTAYSEDRPLRHRQATCTLDICRHSSLTGHSGSSIDWVCAEARAVTARMGAGVIQAGLRLQQLLTYGVDMWLGERALRRPHGLSLSMRQQVLCLWAQR